MDADNRKFADGDDWFADNTIWSFTYREMQRVLTSSRFWIGFSAVVVILAVMGPFGTDRHMNLPERLVYWAFSSFFCFLIGAAVSMSSGLAIALLCEFLQAM